MILSSKFKKATFLLLTGTILLSTSLPTYAMEDDGKTSIPHIPLQNKEQEVHYVTARQRLNLVKSYYEKLPNITMNTSVEGLYEELYKKELAFIRQEVITPQQSWGLDGYEQP